MEILKINQLIKVITAVVGGKVNLSDLTDASSQRLGSDEL